MKPYLISTKLTVILGVCLISCVPPSYFTEVEAEKDDCKRVREELLADNEKLTVENTELKANLELADKDKERITQQGISNVEELKDIRSQYNQLSNRYKELESSHQALINGSDAETRALMGRLDNTQRDLHQREDQLNQLQAKLDKDRSELNKIQRELQQKSSRLVELEEMMNRKDAEAESLKQKLSEALMGFEDQGLTITKKNGKVYVSLDEKLLFASGSTQVDQRGQNALRQLGAVLEQNPGINIMIEGHTDDVPVKSGASFKDNWDLSVQRATSIIRILLDGTSINPSRLTAAGRSEFQPVDTRDNADARQKNRRTEIILTPNLDEIFQLLE